MAKMKTKKQSENEMREMKRMQELEQKVAELTKDNQILQEENKALKQRVCDPMKLRSVSTKHVDSPPNRSQRQQERLKAMMHKVTEVIH